jgi:phosphate-selective porin OprO and OprP
LTIHVTAFAAAFVGVPASAHPDSSSPEPDPAPPPVAGSPHTAPPESYAFKWRFDWRGWEGLQLEVSKQTFAPDALTDLPVVRLDEVKLTGTIGGKLEVDAAAFNTTGTLTGFDDGVQLRRARIRARGDSVLLVPFNYRIDLGYASNQFTVTQAYLAFPNLDYIGTLRIGQFQPPMGLDVITSSWDIAFMEPPAPLQAIAPSTQTGIQIGAPFADARGTWALGLFGLWSTSSEYGSTSKNFGNAIGRITWLPVDGINADRPAANRFLHLGISTNIQYASDGQLQYRSRPESYIAPYVVDTGAIQTDKAATFGGEVAWVNGPFSAQGEFIRSTVDERAGSKLTFDAFYAFASWYPTGESRPYDRQSGAFQRLIPRSRFAFGEGGGWGALEVALRYSHTNLTDGNVQGGRLNLLMGTLNWYPTPNIRWMLEAGVGSVRNGASDGNLTIVQTRVGVDF